MSRTPPTVTVVGAGVAGLATAYDLKTRGFAVTILESSSRVGGRVSTNRHKFTQGLYGELGAMRLPKKHEEVRYFINELGLDKELVHFEQSNKYIYLKRIGKRWSYEKFQNALIAQDPKLLDLFPGLHPEERGKTLDDLWKKAVAPVIKEMQEAAAQTKEEGELTAELIEKYSSYSLETYLSKEAGWSDDCIRMYDMCSAHVVLKNSLLESLRDSYLSSEDEGITAGMQRLKGGMDRFATAFLYEGTLSENIIFGARVTGAIYKASEPQRVTVEFTNEITGDRITLKSDYVVFTLPCLSMHRIRATPHFSHQKEQAHKKTTYAQVTKALIQFRTRFWDKDNTGKGGGLVTDLPIRYLMFPTATPEEMQETKGRCVVMAAYCFGEDARNLASQEETERKKTVVSSLCEIFPDEDIKSNIEACTFKDWSADGDAGGGAFAYFQPDEEVRYHAHLIKPEWDERAHFAGEHTSNFHGWIEGGLQSAARVTKKIAAHSDFGISSKDKKGR